MSKATGSTIFVLTDTPGAYGEDLNHHGETPIFIKDMETLFERLKDVPMAGLVLELTKVMNASRTERNRLFQYADAFPVLRTKLNPRHGFIAYLDPRDCFFSNLDAAAGKRSRSHDRIQVKLDCAFSREEDFTLAEPLEGIIRDISPGGCFVNTHKVFEGERFVNLRIPQLTNPRPIYCSVRWVRQDVDDPALQGMGLMFVDMTEEQAENVLALQVTEQVRQDS